MKQPIETAADLHRELIKHGLELRPEVGRDTALVAKLAKELGMAPNRFITGLEASGKSAEEYLRALMGVVAPFAQMFREVWTYLSRHCAPKADEQIFVRFGFKDEQPTEINWDQFRVMAESTKKVLSTGPVTLWPREELFRLGKIFHDHAGQLPAGGSYERGKPFNLPLIHVSRIEDQVAERVREAIQSWVDAVEAAWPIEIRKTRNIPELAGQESLDTPAGDVQRTLLDLSCLLTDLVPIWRRILTNWNSIPHSTKEAAANFFEKELAPKLGTSIGDGWRSLMEALDILELPFWRHRWHTYEVWATVKALEALDEFHPRPVMKDGHIALDAASPALVATLSAVKPIYAHVQGETKLEKPLGRRKAIKPDLRFSVDDPATNVGTVSIVEFKQRKELDALHVFEVLAAYSLGAGLGGGVVVINYDAIPGISLPPNCTLLGDVHPGEPEHVRAYQEAVRESFVRAKVLPLVINSFVLLDVSGSMGSEYDSEAAQRGLKRLVALPWVKVFRFNDGLETGGDLESDSSISTRGGTQLGAALEQLFSLPDAGIPERLLIVTDGRHDHPAQLLSKCGAYTECTPEELEHRLDWLNER